MSSFINRFPRADNVINGPLTTLLRDERTIDYVAVRGGWDIDYVAVLAGGLAGGHRAATLITKL
jgi:hypothetical protein